MASTREERMQQRLRGAQRRQVKDVDFGLVFSAPAAPAQQLEAPRTNPQTELSPQVSTRKTPASRGRGRPPNAKGTEESTPVIVSNVDDANIPASRGRGRPPNAKPAEERSTPVIRSRTNDANISAKRRKLDSDDAPSSSVRSTRSSLHAPRRDIYELVEDEVVDPIAAETTDDSIEQVAEESEVEPEITAPTPRLRSAVGPALPSPILEEILESPKNKPGSGHRMRRGLNQATLESSQLQDALQSDELEPAQSSPVPQRKRKKGEATPNHQDSVAKSSRHSQVSQGDADELDELSPNQLRGRGRKPKKLVAHQSANFEPEEATEDPIEEAEEIDDEEAAAALQKNRRSRISRNMHEESPDLDEPIKESVPTPSVARKGRTKPLRTTTPAKQRQPKSAVQVNKKAARTLSKKAARGSKNRLGSPIPVTVHRFTKRPLYEEDETDADILNAEIPYIKRGGVNPIDVLSQVCYEIIGSSLDTLDEGLKNSEDPALRKEYRTKRQAVEAFGKELQLQLLEHTIALDNNFALEKRVREEQRKKLALREEILRIRAEREQIALRMDEIRIKHENESKEAQERDGLNNMIHDIEVAIERGKEQDSHDTNEKTGIDLLVKRVAGEVSNKSDSGGILKQFKDFNAFLERAALALEARKS